MLNLSYLCPNVYKYDSDIFLMPIFPICPGDTIKNLPTNAGDLRDIGSICRSGRHPGDGHGNPLPVFLPGGCHGQRSLAGYSPWGCRESDTTEVI